MQLVDCNLQRWPFTTANSNPLNYNYSAYELQRETVKSRPDTGSRHVSRHTVVTSDGRGRTPLASSSTSAARHVRNSTRAVWNGSRRVADRSSTTCQTLATTRHQMPQWKTSSHPWLQRAYGSTFPRLDRNLRWWSTRVEFLSCTIWTHPCSGST